MLKALYEAIRGDAQAQEIKLSGRTYTTQQVYPVIDPIPADLTVTTLTGLVDYIKSNVDKLNMSDLICHVVDPTEVRVYGRLSGDFVQRSHFLTAQLTQLQIPLNKMIDNETFCVALQSCFADGSEPYATDKGIVLKFASSVKSIMEAGYSDDGVAQSVSVQASIASKEVKRLPNPVLLAPFRTFTEVVQPSSKFIFRAKSDDGMKFGLYEADGGAWRGVAMQSIKEFLVTSVHGLNVIA